MLRAGIQLARIEWDGELLYSREQTALEEKRVQRAAEARQRRTCPMVDATTVFHYCGRCQNPVSITHWSV